MLYAKKRKLEENPAPEDIYIHVSNRVIDVKSIADELWCKKCNLQLSLKHIVKEKILGLASIFHVKCTKCKNIYLVNISSFKTNDTNYKQFNINLRLAFGKY